MRRNIYKMWMPLLVALCALAACDETSEEYRYDNWEARNNHYMDSIAQVAQANASGQWKILKSYTLPADQPGDILQTRNPLNYIYVKVLEEGDGIVPQYADTVRVHYRGMYMNGDVFDQSYKGKLDVRTAVPSKFLTSGLINGWTTALQQMPEGARWEVYIPWTLGYGPGSLASSTSSIMEYSVLCFDMQLARVYPSSLYNSKNPVPAW